MFEHRSEDTWSEPQALQPADGPRGRGFGHSVAIDGDALVVGEPSGLKPGRVLPSGRVHVFERSRGGTGSWDVTHRQRRRTGRHLWPGSAAQWGPGRVSASGADTWLRRNRGKVYVFDRRDGSDGTGNQPASLVVGRSENGLASEVFANGDAVAVGVPDSKYPSADPKTDAIANWWQAGKVDVSRVRGQTAARPWRPQVRISSAAGLGTAHDYHRTDTSTTAASGRSAAEEGTAGLADLFRDRARVGFL